MPKKNYQRPDNRISLGELELLLDNIEDSETRVALIIAYYTGARHQEILNLKRMDIQEDDSEETLNFKIRSLKRTDQHFRNIPIRRDKPYINVVENWIKNIPLGQPVFTKYRQRMNYYFYKGLEKTDLPISFHAFRHSVGSKLAHLGYRTHDIAQYLGHANLNTTQHYIDASPERLKNMSDAL